MKMKLVCCVLAATAAAACGKSNSTTEPAAAGETAKPAAAAAPEAPKLALGDPDPAVVAQLKKVTACKWEDDGLDSDCHASSEFSEFYDKFVEVVVEGDTDVDKTKRAKVANTCLGFVADADVRIRYLAIHCVTLADDSLIGDKAAAGLIFARLEAETSAGNQEDLSRLIQELSPAQVGLGEHALSLIPKFKDNPVVYGALLDATWSDDVPPPAAAFDVAAEALKTTKKDNVTVHAVKVMTLVKPRAADACNILGGLVAAKDKKWIYAAVGMANMGDACKARFDAIVTVAVEKMAVDGGKPGEGILAIELIKLRDLTKNKTITKDQKDKLAAAARALAGRTKDDDLKVYADQLAKAMTS